MLGIILNVIIILGCQVLVYISYLKQRIVNWGATDEEIRMPLIGDDQAPGISATRAISIAAPQAEVWKWLIQLGADRGGFFSYELIEKALGYEFRHAELTAEFQDMPVGRRIPASLDESKSFIKYDFTITQVDPGAAFVLGGWGAFVLQAIDANHTRLIVRTHAQETPTLLKKVEDFLSVPTHYIMERRMMIGFKAIAEEGKQPSAIDDNMWLLGLVLSALGIALMVLSGIAPLAMILSTIFGVAWLWVLLIPAPRPLFSLGLLLLIVLSSIWV